MTAAWLSCHVCGYEARVWQGARDLVHAPLACPECGDLDLEVWVPSRAEAAA